MNFAWNHGTIVVAAAGNDGATTPNYPAGDEKVVGVAATDQGGALWSGSNSSDAAFISAPGVDIAADSADGGVASVTGTSASAAVVAVPPPCYAQPTPARRTARSLDVSRGTPMPAAPATAS